MIKLLNLCFEFSSENIFSKYNSGSEIRVFPIKIKQVN